MNVSDVQDRSLQSAARRDSRYAEYPVAERRIPKSLIRFCLLYTSDAADE